MQRKNRDVLRKSLSTLTKRERGNLAWHIKEETPILCGGDALSYYLNGGG